MTDLQDSVEVKFWDRIRSTPNEDPLDETLLLVFADWLQDRDDPRAEALRVIVKHKVYPYWFAHIKHLSWVIWNMDSLNEYGSKTMRHDPDIHQGCFLAHIPKCWWEEMDQLQTIDNRRGGYVSDYPTRLDAFKNLVNAYTLMTDEDRANLEEKLK